MKEEREIRLKSTNSIRNIGNGLLFLSIIIGIILCITEKYAIFAIPVISSGLGLKIIFQIAYEICYRLDLIADKK